jgi:ABC-2 type transport system permease protein
MNGLTVVWKDLLILLKDRGQLVSLFLLPLAFIVPISLAFPPDGYNLNADRQDPLPLAVYDLVDGAPSERAQELIEALDESFWLEWQHAGSLPADLGVAGACAAPGPGCDEAVLRARIAGEQRAVGLIIPAGLEAAVSAGEAISLTLLYAPSGDAVTRLRYAGIVEGAATALSVQNQIFGGFDQLGDFTLLAPPEVRSQIEAQINAGRDEAESAPQGAALRVVKVLPASVNVPQQPNTLQQTVPGYTVMFVFFIIAYVSAAWTLEVNSGTLQRLRTLPVGGAALLVGKLLAAFLVGLAQMGLMFAVGRFAFGLQLGADPLALLLVSAATVASAVAIGLAAATWGFGKVSSMPLIVAALLGGCAFPADWLPSALRTAGMATPHSWAMRALQDLLTRGETVTGILLEVGILLLFTIVFFGVALRRLRWSN